MSDHEQTSTNVALDEKSNTRKNERRKELNSTDKSHKYKLKIKWKPSFSTQRKNKKLRISDKATNDNNENVVNQQLIQVNNVNNVSFDGTVKKRRSKSLENNVKSKKVRFASPLQVVKLYNTQNNVCPICEQQLDQVVFSTIKNKDKLPAITINSLSKQLQDSSCQTDRIIYKITNYSVYCKNKHLCKFNFELIKSNPNIMLSGCIEPMNTTDDSKENKVYCKNIRSIKDYWITGFKFEENLRFGFSIGKIDYILCNPSNEYVNFMNKALVPYTINKLIVEMLYLEPHTTFEELLAEINLSVDDLIYYALFICQQLLSFDETIRPNGPCLLSAPCIRRIIDLAGIKLDFKLSQLQKMPVRRFDTSDQQISIITPKRSNTWIKELLPANIDKLVELSIDRNRIQCGICEYCQRSCCGNCTACIEKNLDSCLHRRCFARKSQELEVRNVGSNINIVHPHYTGNLFQERMTHIIKDRKLKWVGKPIAVESNVRYYKAFKLGKETIVVGNFVHVNYLDSSLSNEIFKIVYAWEDQKGVARFHANYLLASRNTILAEFSNDKEYFFVNKCSALPISCIIKKVNLTERSVSNNWNLLHDDVNHDSSSNQLYCDKCYDPVTGRFYDLLSEKDTYSETPRYRFCRFCYKTELQTQRNNPRPIKALSKVKNKVVYGGVMYKGEEFCVGNSVYFKPKTLYFNYPMQYNFEKLSSCSIKNNDAEKYPEYYRKIHKKSIQLKYDIPTPFDVGHILEIFTIDDSLCIKVKKLYRPENTHKGLTLSTNADINLLFWSNEDYVISFKYVVGKCHVNYVNNISNVNEWTFSGCDRFYFKHVYKKKEFLDINDNTEVHQNENKLNIKEDWKDYPKIKKKNTLEIFAGCGGLSFGLKEAGLSNCRWAIGQDVSAISTFKLNNVDTVTFVGNCNDVLENIIKGDRQMNNQLLPLKGEVEFLCASLPAESDIENMETFLNSQIATFVSYCKYFKPPFFMLETNERLIENNTVLKLTLACFVSIGYQVAFYLLQVGCYGAPQNQRRSVIMGAAPGQILPNYPKHLHVFPKSLTRQTIIVDNKTYTQTTEFVESAPYRSVTILDALSDLQSVQVNKNVNVIKNFNVQPSTSFQKRVRKDMFEPILFDHVCKDVSLLDEARIAHIPKSPGSNWCDLPNIQVELRNGKRTNVLKYKYNDPKTGKPGICCCTIGVPCDPNDRQPETLLPWYLVHSANRHADWSELYSRLQWDGYFNGVTTNPEPLGEQGPVIHPSQPRIVSVRECARIQGFPDNYTFGPDIDVYSQYKLIGQSASPLLAQAIGREFIASIVASSLEDAN